MKKICLLKLVLFAMFVSCGKDPVAEKPAEKPVEKPTEEKHKGTIFGLPGDSDTYYVESIYGKENVEEGKFDSSLDGTDNDNPELVFYFLKDSEGKVAMMSRVVNSITNDLVINSETTALALVTMHPFFAMIPENEFEEISKLIKEQDSFSALKNNVESVVKSGGDLLSENNIEILKFRKCKKI